MGLFGDAVIPGTEIDVQTAVDSAIGVATLVVGALVINEVREKESRMAPTVDTLV